MANNVWLYSFIICKLVLLYQVCVPLNFSVDVLVAIVAFYITLHNLVNQYKLISEHGISKKPFVFQIFGYVIGLFIVIITLKSPFDISFAILVIAFLTNKKLFEKELNSIKMK